MEKVNFTLRGKRLLLIEFEKSTCLFGDRSNSDGVSSVVCGGSDSEEFILMLIDKLLQIMAIFYSFLDNAVAFKNSKPKKQEQQENVLCNYFVFFWKQLSYLFKRGREIVLV